MSKKGVVYLIGAGPGDRGLITIKGKELLQKANVIVFDYLVNTEILEYAQDNAEILYVGKKAGQKGMTQRGINALLIRKAKKENIVARLKGGDPFTFGRGGEEAEALKEKKIPFEIVPGVSSVSAVPAYGGISLTHRDFTSSFAVVTGHEHPSKAESTIPWEALSQIGTVVFLMGVKKLKQNMRELIKAGKNPETPVAVITWGTYPKQRTLTGTIEDISELVSKDKEITSPGIVVVGEVVRLRKIINWYESKPLFGKTIIVTRPKSQATEFIKLLEEQGAQVISFPTIEIRTPDSYKALDKAINNIEKYDWIIFTSVNGVTSFFNRLRDIGKDIRELHSAKIAAIGEVTAQEIENLGMKVDIVPDNYKAEGLIKLFKNKDIEESKILIPRAKVARDILPDSLAKMGASVDVVAAYITKHPGKAMTKEIGKLLSEDKIDMITFTSSSTARNFFELVPGFKQSKGRPVIASIGPITAKTVRDAAYKSSIIPKQYTVEYLAKEIVDYFKKRKLK
ncbi:MAG: uroporphyrinogen III methyltransferase [Thermodesulfobacteriota bacterium]|nr:MAG: uroporphyrinogen III methyltransferase [Thermodesulfobacteriota bacterium]